MNKNRNMINYSNNINHLSMNTINCKINYLFITWILNKINIL